MPQIFMAVFCKWNWRNDYNRTGKNMAKSLDMTTGKPSKLLLQFAIPLIIGNLFQQAYTLADRVIVGQFVGADAYSAVGATTALTNLFMSVCMEMSIGAGVVVA